MNNHRELSYEKSFYTNYGNSLTISFWLGKKDFMAPKDYEIDWDEENPDQPDDTPVISGGPGRGYLTEEDIPSFEFFVE